MGKSRVIDGIRLYEHFVESNKRIGSYWEKPEWSTAQTSEGILHYCRQALQYLIEELVEWYDHHTIAHWIVQAEAHLEELDSLKSADAQYCALVSGECEICQRLIC